MNLYATYTHGWPLPRMRRRHSLAVMALWVGMGWGFLLGVMAVLLWQAQ